MPSCAWSIRRKSAAGKARAEQECPCAPTAKQSLCQAPGAHTPLVQIPGLVLVASPQLNPVSSLPPTCFQVNISDQKFGEFFLRLHLLRLTRNLPSVGVAAPLPSLFKTCLDCSCITLGSSSWWCVGKAFLLVLPSGHSCCPF